MIKAKSYKEEFINKNEMLTLSLEELHKILSARSYLKLDTVLKVITKDQIMKDGKHSAEDMEVAAERDDRDNVSEIKRLMNRDEEFKKEMLAEFPTLKADLQKNFSELYTMMTTQFQELSSHVSKEAQETRDVVIAGQNKISSEIAGLKQQNEQTQQLLRTMLEHRDRQESQKTTSSNEKSVQATTVQRKDSTSLLLTKQQIDNAVSQVAVEAQKGDPCSLYTLGLCYKQGRGVKADAVKAYEMFDKAAKLGHAKSMRLAGVALYYGQGVKMDQRRAYELFEKAGHEGDPRARLNMSLMTKDPYLAREYEKSIPSMEELSISCPKNDDHGMLKLKIRHQWICDECHSRNFAGESRYCKECDFDLCYSCSLSMQPLMREIECTCPKGHGALTCKVPYQKSGGRWMCNGCDVIFNNNGDLSQNCTTCQYDLCYVCALQQLQHGQANLKTKINN